MSPVSSLCPTGSMRINSLRSKVSSHTRETSTAVAKKKFSRTGRRRRCVSPSCTARLPTSEKISNKASNSIRNHAIVCIEDLQVQNMFASATGKGARAKPGLNRSILDASPFELRRQLEYKDAWRGGSCSFLLRPQNTSICPCCEQVSKDNRKTQAEFVCVECGFSENADLVAAINIKRQGIASLACSPSSGDVSPSWQEPTEGDCAA